MGFVEVVGGWGQTRATTEHSSTKKEKKPKQPADSWPFSAEIEHKRVRMPGSKGSGCTPLRAPNLGFADGLLLFFLHALPVASFAISERAKFLPSLCLCNPHRPRDSSMSALPHHHHLNGSLPPLWHQHPYHLLGGVALFPQHFSVAFLPCNRGFLFVCLFNVNSLQLHIPNSNANCVWGLGLFLLAASPQSLAHLVGAQ